MIKSCGNCNKDFKTYKSKQIYCSKECSGEASRLKKVINKCEYSGCSHTIEIYEGSINNKQKRFCCTTCQNKWQEHAQLGKNNGNYGRKNSWGTHSKKKRKEISDKVKESWKNPERLEKHLKFLDRHRLEDGSFDFQDEFFRDRISKANIERLKNNPTYGAYSNCKRGWYLSTKSGDEEYYHSSWEELKMLELDNDNEILTWTKKHEHVVIYFDGKIKKRYLPDFLINNVKMLEVKGYIDNVRVFKLKCEAALIYFNSKGIDYELDFMKNTKKYYKLIEWFNVTKEKYYGKKKN